MPKPESQSRETLLSQSRIWLFGRVLDDLIIDSNVYSNLPDTDPNGEGVNTAPWQSTNDFVRNQLRKTNACLARIVGFAYENAYTDIGRPAVFLVHGAGVDPEQTVGLTTIVDKRSSRSPADVGRTGLATIVGQFGEGVRAWGYDRADFTMRIDVDTGSFDSLLLVPQLGDWDAGLQSAGSMVRSSGSMVRSAGSMVRSAGSMVRGSRTRGSGE